MKIDAHQHFWHYTPDAYGWISDDMAVLKRDFLPADLQPLLKAAGYAGSVAVQAQQTEDETTFLLQLAASNPILKGVVGWVDLQAENIAERLAFFAQNPLFKGVRHIVQAEPDPEFLLRPEFKRGIKALQPFNLTYDILIFPQQLPVAVELVQHFPEQPFVLDHLAKPFIKNKQAEPWAQHLKQLAQHPNVYCKLSGMVTEADWQNWQPADFIPYLETALEAFGANRLMIGSDWPVCKLAGEYEEVMNLVTNYIQNLSGIEQENILGNNAIRFYTLSV